MVDVSVIIPVYNDLHAIKLTLKALLEQSVSSEIFEIIIIDNGSTDGTIEWLVTQKGITLLKESGHKGSPYSCRNRGLEVASGNIIVLLDSTCIPASNWIESGVAFFERTQCQFFGGRVKFHDSHQPSSWRLFDSITHVQMEESIKLRKEAKTANLWVKKELFDQFGNFKEGVRSGEDVRWTSSCTLAGVELHYAKECIVRKFSRGMLELLSKQYRIGKGQVTRWHGQGIVLKKILSSCRALVPSSPQKMKVLIARNEDYTYSTRILLDMYLITFTARFVTICGNVIGLFTVKNSSANKA